MIIIHEGCSCVAFSIGCVWPNTSRAVFIVHISTIVLPFSIDAVLILSIWIQIWMIFQRFMREFDEINPTEDFIYKMPDIHTKQISTQSVYTCLYNRLHDETHRLTYDVSICHNLGYGMFSKHKKYRNRYYEANWELGVAVVFQFLKFFNFRTIYQIIVVDVMIS